MRGYKLAYLHNRTRKNAFDLAHPRFFLVKNDPKLRTKK